MKKTTNKQAVEKVTAKATKAFNMQAKKFFLTFPQIPEEKVIDFPEIKARILEKQDIKNGIIAREKHKDGNIHFHIYLEYNKTKTINRPDYFDFIFQHHGKYETCKAKVAVIKYLTKSLDYFLIGDLNSFSSSILLRNFAKKSIKQGGDTHDFFSVEDNADIDNLIYDDALKLTRYGKIYRKYLHESAIAKLSFVKSFDLSRLKASVQAQPKVFTNPEQLVQIVAFLNNNLEPSAREYKKPMLHLGSSAPNTGKTSLLHFLQHLSPCYIWPDDNWFDTYNNHTYQGIMGDEWSPKGGDGPFLNRFLAGERMRLPMKGSHTMKHDNPLLLLTSNKSMWEHCRGKWRRQEEEAVLFTRTFQARVHDFQVTKPLFNDFSVFRRSMLDCTVLHPAAPTKPILPF